MNGTMIEDHVGEAIAPGHAQGSAESRRMYRVLDLVAAERVRQRSLLADGHITHDCADPATPDDAALRIACEELGEVARGIDKLAALDRRERAMKKDFSFRRGCLSSDLRNEWIQLAAVAVARVEAMEP